MNTEHKSTARSWVVHDDHSQSFQNIHSSISTLTSNPSVAVCHIWFIIFYSTKMCRTCTVLAQKGKSAVIVACCHNIIRGWILLSVQHLFLSCLVGCELNFLIKPNLMRLSSEFLKRGKSLNPLLAFSTVHCQKQRLVQWQRDIRLRNIKWNTSREL